LNPEKNSDFYKIYEREKKVIEKKLLNSVKNRTPFSLYKPAYYTLQSGGKRLRPLLVLFSVHAAGGRFSKAYNAAVAVELLHNFTLVHDDIMDNAEKRRGRLTLHKKYDTNSAILTGDSLLSVAYESLLKDCNGNSKKILNSFTQGLVEVCEGQGLDKEFETKTNVALKEYILMISKKTAALSEMCCKIGGLLAGASTAKVNALAGYGRNVGIAFQIQDDLLDVIGDEDKFGKIIGSDLVEGKKTYLFVKAFQKAKGKDKENLNKLIKDKGIKKDKVKVFRDIYTKLGVLDDARKDILSYSEKALDSIKKIGKDKQKFFEWLTESLIERNK
jgi:geranylgeranyl diphosphate synthase, type II